MKRDEASRREIQRGRENERERTEPICKLEKELRLHGQHYQIDYSAFQREAARALSEQERERREHRRDEVESEEIDI